MKQISMPNTPESGLAYRAVKFAHLTKPVWVLQDEQGIYWVDLKSVLMAVGMSWPRWQLVLRQQHKAWQMTTCLDRHLSETRLIPEQSFVRWLALPVEVAEDYAPHIQTRVRLLRGGWTTRFDELYEQDEEAGLTPRRITQALIEQTYQLRRVVGKSIADTAKELGVGTTTVKKIERGDPKWPAQLQKTWRQSFGAVHNGPPTP